MEAPSRLLDADHHVIQRLLDVLERMAAEAEKGDPLPNDDVEAALEVLVGFADACHHGKEEQVLFPALREAEPAAGDKVASALEGDHKAGRKLVAAMRLHATAARDDPSAWRASGRQARIYATLLRAHIQLEEKELFPLVDRAFTAEEAARLAAAFGRMGPGGSDGRYGTLVRDLAARYVD